MSDLKQRLNAAIEKVFDGIEDLSTLTVITYTGNLTVTLPGDKLDLKKAVPTVSELHVAAMTQISVDNDISQVQGQADLPAGLQQLHSDAVQAAIQARASLVKMLADVVTKL